MDQQLCDYLHIIHYVDSAKEAGTKDLPKKIHKKWKRHWVVLSEDISPSKCYLNYCEKETDWVFSNDSEITRCPLARFTVRKFSGHEEHDNHLIISLTSAYAIGLSFESGNKMEQWYKAFERLLEFYDTTVQCLEHKDLEGEYIVQFSSPGPVKVWGVDGLLRWEWSLATVRRIEYQKSAAKLKLEVGRKSPVGEGQFLFACQRASTLYWAIKTTMDLLVLQPERSPVLQPTKSPVLQHRKSPVLQPSKSPVLQPRKFPVLQPRKSPVLQARKSPAEQSFSIPENTGPLIVSKSVCETDYTLDPTVERSSVILPVNTKPLMGLKCLCDTEDCTLDPTVDKLQRDRVILPANPEPLMVLKSTRDTDYTLDPTVVKPQRSSVILPVNTEPLVASKSGCALDAALDPTVGKSQHACKEPPTTTSNPDSVSDDTLSQYTSLVHRDRTNTYDTRPAPRQHQGQDQDGDDTYTPLAHQNKPHTYDVRLIPRQSPDKWDDGILSEYMYTSWPHQDNTYVYVEDVDDDGDYI